MILRTPPAKRKAEPYTVVTPGSAAPNGQLVVYEEPSSNPPPAQSQSLLCTYQCHQMVKSEFIDALITAENKNNDLQSRLQSLEAQLSKNEEEAITFQNQLNFLEQELAASKGREQALQEQLIKEVQDGYEHLQVQLKCNSELEVKLQNEVKLRKDAESAASTAELRCVAIETKLKDVTESFEREKIRLHEQLLHAEGDSRCSITRINADLELMECRACNAERESELFRAQIEDLQVQLKESRKESSLVELSVVNHPSCDVSQMEAQTLVKHLQEELRNYECEVHEARKMKALHENAELLKEKIQEERHRREQVEVQLLKLHDVEQNAIKLQDELMLWKSILRDIPGVESHDDIAHKVSCLQRELMESTKTSGDLTSQLKQLESELEKIDVDKKLAQKLASLAEHKFEEQTIELKRLEHAVSAVTAERDRLRALVAAFEKESSPQKKQKNQDEGANLVSGILVKGLEASITEKESTIKELEHNLNELRKIIKNHTCEIELLNEKLNAESRRTKSLEHEGDRLRSEISLLECKLGQGEYSAASTKILRMVNTLAIDNEAKCTIEALRTELQKAQARLQAIDDFKGQPDAGMTVDVDISEKLAQLRGQIAVLEKREERYKTVFAEKISVFRRACCSLFGYKIVMDDRLRPNGIPATLFTLQSIYAQNDDEKLEFEYESGNTTILPNSYTHQPDISQQIEIFIRRWNAVPAFTANLTIESFNKRTLS